MSARTGDRNLARAAEMALERTGDYQQVEAEQDEGPPRGFAAVTRNFLN